MHQTITHSKEWTAWREINNYPLSPYKEAIQDAELSGYFTPKHWRAFSDFLQKAGANKHKTLKVRINKYYAKEKDGTT